MKYAILLYLLVLLVQSSLPQICHKFNNNLCIKCPSGMYLHLGHCFSHSTTLLKYSTLFHYRNCHQSYICQQSHSYVLTNFFIRTLPNAGFLDLAPSTYQRTDIRNVLNILREKYRFLGPLTIFKIYQSKNTNNFNYLKKQKHTSSTFYRIITIIDTGLLETLLLYNTTIHSTNNKLNCTISFLYHRIFEKYHYQLFAELDSDRNAHQIYNQIQQLYPQQAKYPIVDCFKSYNINTAINQYSLEYRIIIANPNQGLSQVKINITLQSNANITTQQLDIINLQPQLEQIIRQITNSQQLNKYFLGSSLKNVKKIEKDETQSYHVIFSYPQVLVTNKFHPQSYLIFQIHQNSDKIEVSEIAFYKRSQINKHKYTFNKKYHNSLPTSNKNRILQSVVFPQSSKKKGNISCILPNSSIPTYKVIPLNMVFIQYIDILKFINSQAFQILRLFIFKYFPTLAIGNDIVGVAKAQAQAQDFYQVIYKVYSTDQPLIYFIFCISKTSKQFILINQFRVPLSARKIIIVDARNRDTIQPTFSSIISNILTNYIAKDIIYWKKAQLYQILTFSYQSKVFSQSPQFKILRYIFKYYYPPKPINNQKYFYQYVEFSYQFIQSNQIPIRLNYIAFPPQPFQLVNSSDDSMWDSIKFYVSSHLLGTNKHTWKSYQILTIWKSLISPTNIFKVSISYLSTNGRYMILWRIDIDNQIQTRMISNTTIISTTMKNTTRPLPRTTFTSLPSINLISTLKSDIHNDPSHPNSTQTNLPQSCLQLDQQNTRCLKCNNEYILDKKDGKCYKKINNCEIQQKVKCISCSTGHALSSSSECQ